MIVTVEEARRFLYVEDGDPEDPDDPTNILISNLIEQAQSMAEDFCRVDFDEAEEVPASVNAAILMMVGYLHEHRDADDADAWKTTLDAFQRILWPNRDPAKMF